MNKCTEKDLLFGFTRDEVTIKCRGCDLKMELPSLLYFQKWGYPKGQETLSSFEWLHEVERRLGRNMMEKIKVSFLDMEKGVTLGSSILPFGSLEKLSIGDRVEFKDVGSIFGIYEIHSFAINQGQIEGHIALMPVKSKAKIKLQEINEQHVDSLMPF